MKTKTLSAHQTMVQAVLRYVRDKPRGGLQDLADIACLSPFHFHRVFKKMTGRTPDDHMRALRLVRAATELRTGKRAIVAIALDAQYENHESFSRAFRREFGYSPSAYRRKYRATSGDRMNNFHVAVNLIKIPVTDFAKARTFYRDVLGLEEEFAVDQYGWAQYKAGEIPFCLYVVGMGGGDGKPGGETNIHLAIDDAKQAHAILQKLGTNLPGKLETSDDGGSFFMVADPDGNIFKVVQRV